MSDETRQPGALAAWARHTRATHAAGSDRMTPAWRHEIRDLAPLVVLHLLLHAQLRARWSDVVAELRGTP